MKKVLTSPMQLWHFVVLSVLMVALTGTAVVSAAPTSSFLAQGTVRMAVASATNNDISVASSTAATVLSQTIQVPAGMVADLAVMSEIDIQTDNMTSGYQYCFGRIRLDNPTTGKLFKPGSYMLEAIFPNRPFALSLPINGYLQNVAQGSHTIYLIVSASYGYCNARDRSMIIFANIH